MASPAILPRTRFPETDHAMAGDILLPRLKLYKRRYTADGTQYI